MSPVFDVAAEGNDVVTVVTAITGSVAAVATATAAIVASARRIRGESGRMGHPTGPPVEPQDWSGTARPAVPPMPQCPSPSAGWYQRGEHLVANSWSGASLAPADHDGGAAAREPAEPANRWWLRATGPSDVVFTASGRGGRRAG